MKKYLALLLAIVMIFALVSCAKEEVKEEVNSKETETEEVMEGSGNVSIHRGAFSNETVYHSDYLNLTITLPEQPAWGFTADEELFKQTKVPAALMESDLGNALLQGYAVKDMEATNGSYGSEMYVYYEYTPISASSYLEKELKKLYDLPGISFDSETVKETVTLGGLEYESAYVECESAGATMHRYYYVRSGEDGVITFIYVNLFSGDTTDVKAMFS